MLSQNQTIQPEALEKKDIVASWPLNFVVIEDSQVDSLLSDLDPVMPWAVRKAAAQRLGDHPCPQALQGLLDHLPTDPFWMVRCAIIQTLERTGDPGAVPVLQAVAQNDSFQVVRAYAAKAVDSLT